MDTNTVGMVGTVAVAPEPYHNIYGRENIYALYLDVTRDSGAIDRILVLFQEEKVDTDSFYAEPWDIFNDGDSAALIKEGSRIEVTGAIQTYKYKDTGRTQLFVRGLYLAAVAEDSKAINTVYITGEIAHKPVHRKTPKGRRITEIMLRIPSVFSEGFYSYIPCITWESIADNAAELSEGNVVYLEGRLQSREYVKRTQDGDKTLTTWEVSANKLKACINNQ